MNHFLKRTLSNNLLHKGRSLHVLGIETSCDDTGIAIVHHCEHSQQTSVLGNVLCSQQSFHIRYGGIIPPRARDLHRQNIETSFEKCLREANLDPQEIDAIAVTNRPGLPLSLLVGLRFARYLGRTYNKPLLPVHHMEAHALQARMEYEISYPFLCLLISGGHCQLAFVRSCKDFLLLGETHDDAPGEAFDKIARRLRLNLISKYRNWNGGQIIEDAAKSAIEDIKQRSSDINRKFDFPLPLAQIRDCNFSFAGIKNSAIRAIHYQEKTRNFPPDGILQDYKEFCLALLTAATRHLMHRTQRALEFCCTQPDFFGDEAVPRSLVISGGVANNDTIFLNISQMANELFHCKTYRPSKRYCSDNGVMIAWNGIEQILHDPSKNCLHWNYYDIPVEGKASLGRKITEDVYKAQIKCKWYKIKQER